MSFDRPADRARVPTRVPTSGPVRDLLVLAVVPQLVALVVLLGAAFATVAHGAETLVLACGAVAALLSVAIGCLFLRRGTCRGHRDLGVAGLVVTGLLVLQCLVRWLPQAW